MHRYLTAATLKGAVDRRCGDSSDVLTIAVQPCLLLFNVTVIALLAVMGTESWWAASTSHWLMLQYGEYHLVLGNLLRHTSVFTTRFVFLALKGSLFAKCSTICTWWLVSSFGINLYFCG